MARTSWRNAFNENAASSSPLRKPAEAPLLPAAHIDTFTGDPNFMTSLARGLSVIQAFSQGTPSPTISQLSKKTGLSRAAVRRCMYTMVKLGLADSEDGSHYSLRPSILSLGHSYIFSMPLAKIAQPILERLSQLLRESFGIATLDGPHIIHVAQANVTRILAINLTVGTPVPSFCTSLGRVLLAHLPPEELESCLARIEFTPYTERTITNASKLRQSLVHVRRNGYAIVDQELEMGLRALAVPVQNGSGKVIAALNVGAHAQRVSVEEMLNKFLPHLRAAAQELRMLLN
jgi:IclR family pca regulon transcriptional regulator